MEHHDPKRNISRINVNPGYMSIPKVDHKQQIHIQKEVKSKISRITETVKSQKYSTTSEHSRYFSASGKKQTYNREEAKAGNEIMVWGSNNFGQLGVGQSLDGMSFPKVRICEPILIINSLNCVCFKSSSLT
jgi:hypothetical protein